MDYLTSVSTKSCTACASSSCVKIGSINAPNPTPVHKAPIAGAIAGGVIGGIVAILLITWLVWRFCIKRRREEFDETSWPEESFGQEKGGDQFTLRRDARASTHTVGSVASTVLTRASNIIQIAYIPGVTNRSADSSPDLLVPPVPPIPAASNQSSNASTPHFTQEHYFMPGDLRDSTFSDFTDDGRSSFARSSIAPSMARSSVATTIYRNNAVINPVPAQTVTRAKAVAVSVNPSGKNSPIDTPRVGTPPVPTIDQRHVQRPFNTASPIVARLGTPKAVTVTKSPSMNTTNPNTSHVLVNNEQSQTPLVQQIAVTKPSRHTGAASTFDDASSDEEAPHVEARRSLMGHGRLPSGDDLVENTPSSSEPPFKAPSSSPETKPSPFSSSSSTSPSAGRDGRQHKHKKSGSLNQIIEEATRRASREPRHGGLGSVGGTTSGSWRKDASPFSDAHIARTP